MALQPLRRAPRLDGQRIRPRRKKGRSRTIAITVGRLHVCRGCYRDEGPCASEPRWWGSLENGAYHDLVNPTHHDVLVLYTPHGLWRNAWALLGRRRHASSPVLRCLDVADTDARELGNVASISISKHRSLRVPARIREQRFSFGGILPHDLHTRRDSLAGPAETEA